MNPDGRVRAKTEQGKASSPLKKTGQSFTARTNNLMAWYDHARRTLPWRSEPGEIPDPYHVWLSEVMLQQTTVATVTPRFRMFLSRWPTVTALAAASLDEVLHEWQGLGYYARARNLHRCAVTVSCDHGGVFPATEEGLRLLPGIGEYTAAAIAAIAFGQASAPVDGNILRVVSRLDRLNTLLSDGRKEVAAAVASMVPADRPGDFVQAMMDLGAMICSPRKPGCDDCPWGGDCEAHAHGQQEAFPVKKAKQEKPTRYGVIYWLEDHLGRVLLRRRPEKGLLGGMMEFPSTEWCEGLGAGSGAAEVVAEHPFASIKPCLHWRPVDGGIRHTFTHFHLELSVVSVRLNEGDPVPATNGIWCRPEEFNEHALPTVMKKVAAHALNPTEP